MGMILPKFVAWKRLYTTILSDTFIIFNFFLGLIVAKKKSSKIQFHIIDMADP